MDEIEVKIDWLARTYNISYASARSIVSRSEFAPYRVEKSILPGGSFRFRFNDESKALFKEFVEKVKQRRRRWGKYK